MTKNNTKPAANVVEPRNAGTTAKTPDQVFEEQRKKDVARIASLKRAGADKIGEALKAGFYVSEQTWPFLMMPIGIQASVSRFYQTVNVAVDIFPSKHTEEAVKMIAFKREAFAKTEIRYAAIDYRDELTDMIAQVGV